MTEYGIQNTQNKAQRPEFRIQDKDYRIQEYRNTWIQGYRDTGIQRYSKEQIKYNKSNKCYIKYLFMNLNFLNTKIMSPN